MSIRNNKHSYAQYISSHSINHPWNWHVSINCVRFTICAQLTYNIIVFELEQNYNRHLQFAMLVGFVPSVPLCSPTTRVHSSWCRSGNRLSSVTPKRRQRYGNTPVARESRGAKPNPPQFDAIHLISPMWDSNLAAFDFAQLQGKVVYAVNVASQDDRTHDNYTLMAQLATTFKDQDFVVLAFPSNWFGQKETWPIGKVKEFVENYSSDIILMDKSDYEMNPVFALGQRFFPGEIHWNFHGKFLFGRNGLPIERFDLLTDDEDITAQVRAACKTPAPDPSEVIKQKVDSEESEDLELDVESALETAR